LLGGALLISLWGRRWPGPYILPWRLGWPRRRHAGAASIALRHPEPDAEGRSVALVVLDKREQ